MQSRPLTRPSPRWAALAVAALATATTSCSLSGGGDDEGEETKGGSAEVVLVTHESFQLPKKLIGLFEKESGYQLEIRGTGDAGELTNKLVLTKDNPTGDVAFGVDNTFATRALDEGVFEASDVEWPAGVGQYALAGDDDHALTPVDNGNVCVNIDDTWFEREEIAPPETLEDLTEPAYRGLFVTPAATTSSPGMAFLLTTIAEYGDEWPDYWERLMTNDTQITSGWTDAYTVDFTQGGGNGDRPIVLSYDSSPAFTVANGESTTSALLDTCFLQVEYAGVLAGADNPEGAQAVVEWLVSPEVQAALPENMYVFPVADGIELPTEWAQHAQRPTDPHTVDPADVDANRDEWLREWGEITTR
ncbi:MAG: thiamine ABC transporter substrate-binding protein [Actinomycetota bacterium]|nr:thiamine ABC transporter substrate-binding protein [Actinomycetota bacterium]